MASEVGVEGLDVMGQREREERRTTNFGVIECVSTLVVVDNSYELCRCDERATSFIVEGFTLGPKRIFRNLKCAFEAWWADYSIWVELEKLCGVIVRPLRDIDVDKPGPAVHILQIVLGRVADNQWIAKVNESLSVGLDCRHGVSISSCDEAHALYNGKRDDRFMWSRRDAEVHIDGERQMRVCRENCRIVQFRSREYQGLFAIRIDVRLRMSALLDHGRAKYQHLEDHRDHIPDHSPQYD